MDWHRELERNGEGTGVVILTGDYLKEKDVFLKESRKLKNALIYDVSSMDSMLCNPLLFFFLNIRTIEFIRVIDLYLLISVTSYSCCNNFPRFIF